MKRGISVPSAGINRIRFDGLRLSLSVSAAGDTPTR